MQSKGWRGAFLPNPGPCAHADRHLAKSQKGLTNAKAITTLPMGGMSDRSITRITVSAIRPLPAPALRWGAASPSQPSWVKLGFMPCAGYKEDRMGFGSTGRTMGGTDGLLGGKLGTLRMGGRRPSQGMQTRYLKLRDYLGVLPTKGSYVLANHRLTSSLFSPHALGKCVSAWETEGVAIGKKNVLPELGEVWRDLPPKQGEMDPGAYNESLQLLRGEDLPRALTWQTLLQVTLGSCSAHRRRRRPHREAWFIGLLCFHLAPIASPMCNKCPFFLHL